jgi:glycosyltransferase involved in cell wall biosynthesis
MNTPLISVITAAYNCESTIERSVSSVLGQTFGDYEHILVDDGSTDRTWAFARALALSDSRIRVFRQPNGGSAAARNRAIAEARGEFIAILDADDVCSPDRFEVQAAFLRQFPEVDVLGSGATLIDSGSRPIGSSMPASGHDELVANIYRRCPFIHSTVMARRSFFSRTGGYDVALRRCQDYDLWLRGYPIARYHNLRRLLIGYRVRNTPWFRSSYYSARVLLRAARRDGRVMTHGWYATRPLLATTLIRAGILSHVKQEAAVE